MAYPMTMTVRAEVCGDIVKMFCTVCEGKGEYEMTFVGVGSNRIVSREMVACPACEGRGHIKYRLGERLSE